MSKSLLGGLTAGLGSGSGKSRAAKPISIESQRITTLAPLCGSLEELSSTASSSVKTLQSLIRLSSRVAEIESNCVAQLRSLFASDLFLQDNVSPIAYQLNRSLAEYVLARADEQETIASEFEQQAAVLSALHGQYEATVLELQQSKTVCLELAFPGISKLLQEREGQPQLEDGKGAATAARMIKQEPSRSTSSSPSSSGHSQQISPSPLARSGSLSKLASSAANLALVAANQGEAPLPLTTCEDLLAEVLSSALDSFETNEATRLQVTARALLGSLASLQAAAHSFSNKVDSIVKNVMGELNSTSSLLSPLPTTALKLSTSDSSTDVGNTKASELTRANSEELSYSISVSGIDPSVVFRDVSTVTGAMRSLLGSASVFVTSGATLGGSDGPRSPGPGSPSNGTPSKLAQTSSNAPSPCPVGESKQSEIVKVPEHLAKDESVPVGRKSPPNASSEALRKRRVSILGSKLIRTINELRKEGQIDSDAPIEPSFPETDVTLPTKTDSDPSTGQGTRDKRGRRFSTHLAAWEIEERRRRQAAEDIERDAKALQPEMNAVLEVLMDEHKVFSCIMTHRATVGEDSPDMSAPGSKWYDNFVARIDKELQHPAGRLAFTRALTAQRNTSRGSLLRVPGPSFEPLSILFNRFLDHAYAALDGTPAQVVMVTSQSLWKDAGQAATTGPSSTKESGLSSNRIYLHTAIQSHPAWQDMKFWEKPYFESLGDLLNRATLAAVDAAPVQRRGAEEVEDPDAIAAGVERAQLAQVVSQVSTYAHNMMDFNVPTEVVKQFVEKMCALSGVSDEHQAMVQSLVDDLDMQRTQQRNSSGGRDESVMATTTSLPRTPVGHADVETRSVVSHISSSHASAKHSVSEVEKQKRRDDHISLLSEALRTLIDGIYVTHYLPDGARRVLITLVPSMSETSNRNSLARSTQSGRPILAIPDVFASTSHLPVSASRMQAAASSPDEVGTSGYLCWAVQDIGPTSSATSGESKSSEAFERWHDLAATDDSSQQVSGVEIYVPKCPQGSLPLASSISVTLGRDSALFDSMPHARIAKQSHCIALTAPLELFVGQRKMTVNAQTPSKAHAVGRPERTNTDSGITSHASPTKSERGGLSSIARGIGMAIDSFATGLSSALSSSNTGSSSAVPHSPNKERLVEFDLEADSSERATAFVFAVSELSQQPDHSILQQALRIATSPMGPSPLQSARNKP